MRLKFGFFDGTTPVDIKTETLQATPLELLVSATGDFSSQYSSLQTYIASLDYLFKGVSNLASASIESVLVEKSWFGSIEKKNLKVTWKAVNDKSLVVQYTISKDGVSESMYVADSIRSDEENKVSPVWSKKLFKQSMQLTRDNIISAITIATTVSDRYKLVWGFGGKNAPTILDENGVPTLPEDIADDESYALMRLLLLLSVKGAHMGVYMVDCRGFSDKFLRALSTIAKAYHGDAFLFFYNLSETSEIDRVKVMLPNIHAK